MLAVVGDRFPKSGAVAMSVIGGIVMEEGGLLNHCSIVARELGIPSVVGVSRATLLIPEGARVTVDGGAGIVRIELD